MQGKSLAEQFNEWRVFPRLFALLFALLLWDTHEWYTLLPNPSAEQSSYAGAMVVAAAGFFKFYVDSGKKNAQD